MIICPLSSRILYVGLLFTIKYETHILWINNGFILCNLGKVPKVSLGNISDDIRGQWIYDGCLHYSSWSRLDRRWGSHLWFSGWWLIGKSPWNMISHYFSFIILKYSDSVDVMGDHMVWILRISCSTGVKSIWTPREVSSWPSTSRTAWRMKRAAEWLQWATFPLVNKSVSLPWKGRLSPRPCPNAWTRSPTWTTKPLPSLVIILWRKWKYETSPMLIILSYIITYKYNY